jgi:hypothetical protein
MGESVCRYVVLTGDMYGAVHGPIPSFQHPHTATDWAGRVHGADARWRVASVRVYPPRNTYVLLSQHPFGGAASSDSITARRYGRAVNGASCRELENDGVTIGLASFDNPIDTLNHGRRSCPNHKPRAVIVGLVAPPLPWPDVISTALSATMQTPPYPDLL